jgi:hypothetical protein
MERGRLPHLAIVTSVALIGCAGLEDLERATPAAATLERHDPPPPPREVERLTVADAAQRITEAACERHHECDGDAMPDSRAACSSELRTGLDPDLAGDECERGVSKEALEDCLADLRSLDCSREVSVEAAARAQRCGAATLCRE